MRRVRQAQPGSDLTSRWLGTIVCNGLTVPIVSIVLEGSEVHFLGCLTRPGNNDYTLEGPYTVFGSDGRGVLQGGWERRETWHCRHGGSLLIDLPLRVAATVPA